MLHSAVTHPVSIKAESGNALFLILLAVILFAALSYAVSNSMRNRPDAATNESQDVRTSTALQFMSSLQQGITRVMVMNGCTDAQISFENPLVGGYVNPNAPPTYVCHIFRPEGGNVPVQRFGSTNLIISGDAAVDGVGTPAADLVYVAHLMGTSFCTRLIRRMYGTSTTDIETVGALSTFKGVFIDPASTHLGDAGTRFFEGKPTGCFGAMPNGNEHLYHVLLAR